MPGAAETRPGTDHGGTDPAVRLEAVEAALAQPGRCMLADRPRFRRRLDRLLGAGIRHKHAAEDLARLADEVAQSVERVAERLRKRPPLAYPEELPVARQREAIAAAIAANQVVIVSAETGSGKTTQLPKICMSLGRGAAGIIGCTQPRRIATLTVAARVAEELGEAPGGLVGHQIRFDARAGPDTCIKFMTDGVLLTETARDRDLLAYDTLIIDEAHERSLNIDFLLGYVKQLLPRRPDLKVIVSSATLDVARFAEYFGGGPVMQIEGKTHPVEVRYRGPADDDPDIPGLVADAVEDLVTGDAPGDILVFLAGERDIRDAADVLRGRGIPDTDIIPLFARLTTAEQRRAFRVTDRRRIILATNVAETSVTIPGIRYVVDTGLARINRYNPRTQVERLHIEPISQASAAQRKGRCGRVAAGVCVRLYAEEDLKRRAEYTDPEIRRSSLASVILRMLALDLGQADEFPFLEPPSTVMLRDGYRELTELGALDAERRLTPLGRQLAKFPLEPRHSRMILAAREQQCLAELLVIVAALATDDPRQRPLDRQEEADRLHARHRDANSDFVALLNLWRFYREAAGARTSNSQMRRFCKENFLSYRRMQEWSDVHEQLAGVAREIGLEPGAADARATCSRPPGGRPPRSRTAATGLTAKPSDAPAADYQRIHRAVLAGLLNGIGALGEDKVYDGARSMRFSIFPGSGLCGRNPKWIVAAERVETSRVYARCVAKVEPEWIEEAAGPLCRHTWRDPYWEAERGHVRALEDVTLYGLALARGRRRDYGSVDPVESRKVFIRAALVDGEMPSPPACLRHNLGLIEEARTLEHKARRHDLLADPESLFAFYDARVPAGICTTSEFRKWLTHAERENPRLLHMRREDVLPGEAGEVTPDQFPDRLALAGEQLKLEYRYEPGHELDGVTCTFRARLLPLLRTWRAEWLVPGLLPAKVTFLLESLPKALKRELQPLPETVRQCVAAMTPYRQPLVEALSAALQQTKGIRLPPDTWQDTEIPPHLRMNFRAVDDGGETLGMDRDLAALESRLHGTVRASGPAVGSALERENAADWVFGEIPAEIEVGQPGWGLFAYPALVDRGTSVSLRLFNTPEEAERHHNEGVRRLLAMRFDHAVRDLVRHATVSQAAVLHYSMLGGKPDELKTAIVGRALDRAFLENRPAVRSKAEFEKRAAEGRAPLYAAARQAADLVGTILASAQDLAGELRQASGGSAAEVRKDVEDQLRHLVFPGFVGRTAFERLRHYPRYFEAIRVRLRRLRHDPAKDREKAAQLAPFWNAYRGTRAAGGAGIASPREFEAFRWMIEEFRVSLFAQELKTALPVSAKRIEEQWQKATGKA